MKKTVLVVLAVVMAWALASCGSTGASREPVEVVYQEIPYGELESAIANVQSEGQGFIVEAYFRGAGEFRDYDTHKQVPGIGISGTKDGEGRGYRRHSNDEPDFNYATPHQFEIYDFARYSNDHWSWYRYIDLSKPYKMYVGVYRRGRSWVPFIDKMEGFPKPEPVEVVYKEIPYSELKNAIANVQSEGQGFIVDAYIDSSAYISDVQNGKEYVSCELHQEADTKNTLRFVTPPQFEVYSSFYSRIDKSRKYKCYIGVYHSPRELGESRWEVFIDKVEGLLTMEEAEAAKKAEAAAEAAKKEAQFNPGKLDRSSYKETTAGEFSFDMATGKLPAGTKVTFNAQFIVKPSGTKYNFKDVNALITLSTTHNFVRYMHDGYFGPYQGTSSWNEQRTVKVFLTVKKPGQTGECSVDIVEW